MQHQGAGIPRRQGERPFAGGERLVVAVRPQQQVGEVVVRGGRARPGADEPPLVGERLLEATETGEQLGPVEKGAEVVLPLRQRLAVAGERRLGLARRLQHDGGVDEKVSRRGTAPEPGRDRFECLLRPAERQQHRGAGAGGFRMGGIERERAPEGGERLGKPLQGVAGGAEQEPEPNLFPAGGERLFQQRLGRGRLAAGEQRRGAGDRLVRRGAQRLNTTAPWMAPGPE